MVGFRARYDMGPPVDNRVTPFTQVLNGIFVTVSGAVGGVLAQNYDGSPMWLIMSAIGGSLTFGLISSSFRPEQGDERKKLIRLNFVNSGALWTIACAITWTMSLHFGTAMVVALILGLFGTQILEALEESVGSRTIAQFIIKWWIGGGR
jgi:hypothetical protein